MINVSITNSSKERSLGRTELKPLWLMKSYSASLDLLCHQFHCYSPVHQEYFFSLFSSTSGIPFLARCRCLKIVTEHFELSTPYVGLDFHPQTCWSVSQLLGLWNDRSLEEEVLVLPGHSWRQLPLQHILHGVCLESNHLAAKEPFRILLLLLLSFILLMFQTY